MGRDEGEEMKYELTTNDIKFIPETEFEKTILMAYHQHRKVIQDEFMWTTPVKGLGYMTLFLGDKEESK